MKYNIALLLLVILLFLDSTKGRDDLRQLLTYRKTITTYSPSSTAYTGAFTAGRSYAVLYRYYLPPNYYNKVGYYSTLYSKIYYNGYGYNFYYGKYGYY